MINPVDQFKARVLKLQPGETYVYFTGRIATARQHMASLDEIATLAQGLHVLKAVVLTQKRLGTDEYQYRLRVLRAVRNADFDKGRAAYLKSIKEAA